MAEQISVSQAEQKLRLALARLAYLASASAGLLALYSQDQIFRPSALIVLAWFGLCYAVIWGRSARPEERSFLRRGADLAALLVVVFMIFRFRQALRGEGLGGEEWRVIVAAGLLALLAINGLTIFNVEDAERSLLAALVLSLYSAIQLKAGTGILLLAGFMWLWLGAMVLAVMIEDGRRRAVTGGLLLEGATAARMLRSGFGLSLLVVALGLGSFLAAGGVSYGSGPAKVPYGGTRDAWRYDREMPFSSQAGLRPRKKIICRITGPKDVYRFRIQAFDTYSRDGWSLNQGRIQGLTGEDIIMIPDSLGLGAIAALPGREFELVVSMQVGAFRVVPVAERPLALAGSFPGALLRDAASGLCCENPLPVQFSYRLRGWRPDWPSLNLREAREIAPEQLGSEYWRLPSDLPSRLSTLAQGLSAEETSPWGKALAIAQSLKESHGYSTEFLVPPKKEGGDPVDYFIFEGSRGNCLNFASALAVMARLAGVPARLVVGYLGHRYDEARGEWLITSADGHAWCEIGLERFGWVPLDPVPPARLGGVPVGGPPDPLPATPPLTRILPETKRAEGPAFDRALIIRAMTALAVTGWPWLLVAGGSFWAGRTMWRVWRMFRRSRSREKRTARNDVDRAYFGFCEAAEKRGYQRREAQTALEYARYVAAQIPALRTELAALAELYTRAEYQDAGPTREMERQAREIGVRLQAALKV